MPDHRFCPEPEAETGNSLFTAEKVWYDSLTISVRPGTPLSGVLSADDNTDETGNVVWKEEDFCRNRVWAEAVSYDLI